MTAILNLFRKQPAKRFYGIDAATGKSFFGQVGIDAATGETYGR